MSEYGTIVNVTTVTLGSTTNVDAASGATTLTVEDNVDMEVGSAVILTTVDGDAAGTNTIAAVVDEDTIELASPLGAALAAGARVDVSPLQRETRASVRLASGGDPVRCIVQHGLADTASLVDGIRDESTAETVLVERTGSDLLVVDVVSEGTVRRIIGPYIATTEDERSPGIVIENDPGGGIIKFLSGVEDEDPGYINPGVEAGGDQPHVVIFSGRNPRAGEQGALIDLGSASGSSSIYMQAGEFTVIGGVLDAKNGVTVDAQVTMTPGGHLIANGNVQAWGSIYSSSLPTGSGSPVVMRGTDGRIHIDSSSRRFKENIELADEAEIVAALLQIVTKTYTRNDGDPTDEGDVDRRYLGTIAEEVADTGLEYLVNRDVDGLPFSINQGAMVTALLAGLRSVHAENAQLRADHAALVERVRDLEARA